MTDSDLTARRYTDNFPPDTNPQVEAFLREHGLPTRVITIFRAVEELHPLEAAGDDGAVGGGGRPTPSGIVIGYSREDDEIFVNPFSGEVYLFASWGDNLALIVNRDLVSFTSALYTVGESYPFTLETEDIEHASAVSNELRDRLVAIDPACVAEPDGYWALFLEDVAVGDYS